MSDSTETWIGEVPVSTKLMYGSERLRLLFTSKRILVDRVGKRGSGAVIGTSLLGRIGEAVEDFFKTGRESVGKKRVKTMTPDLILRAHKDNFAISYSEVVSVVVEQTEMQPRITILTGSDKFEFSSTSRFNYIVDTFKQKLNDKLTVHRIS